MTASLVITRPDGSIQTSQLSRSLVLGRSSAVDLSFPEDGGLSRKHMVFENVEGGWTVQDLGSKNGTCVNGKLIDELWVLRCNDRITAGNVIVEYRDSESSGPLVTFDGDQGLTSGPGVVETSLAEVLAEEGVTDGREVTGHGWNTPGRALLRAGRELALRRPLDELFKILLELAVEAVDADRGAVMTLDNGELTLQASTGGEFRISAAVRDRVILASASMLISNVLDEEELRNRDSILMHNVRSLLAAPLQVDDRVIGLIYLDRSHVSRGFSTDDLSLLTVFSNIAAIRIEHERLAVVEQVERQLQAEISQAAAIQRLHLPADLPVVKGIDLSGRNTPCLAVGGDYFDYLQLRDGRLGIVIADVSGKGLAAALLMMGVQARVQALAEYSDSLDKFVGWLNVSLTASRPENRFVTFFVLALDTSTGDYSYVNAGHNPPLLVRASHDVEFLAAGGLPLGLFSSASYPEAHGRLGPGDCLLLYTDGISEAQSPAEEEYDTARLQNVLLGHWGQPPPKVLDAIEASVEEWTAGAPGADDRTLIFLRKLQTLP